LSRRIASKGLDPPRGDGLSAIDTQTAAERAYLVIRDAILENSLKAGTRLTVRAMADLTGVSVIPVIQALHRLDVEGLIETFPRWGSRVITLDNETVRDRYLLREAVECQVARILATTLSAYQAEELKRLASRLDELVAARDLAQEFLDKDHEIHSLMAEYTGSRSLLKALGHINLFRLMQKTREHIIIQRVGLPADLHMRLVDAILSGDPDVAEKAMREHIFQPGVGVHR
jgi:GntR family transcriptional regulator, rspAB operon transcriptional repressor